MFPDVSIFSKAFVRILTCFSRLFYGFQGVLEVLQRCFKVFLMLVPRFFILSEVTKQR